MVLGDDFHGKMILLDVDVGIVSHGSHQSSLDFGTRIVGMVKDAEFRVTSFTMQVEFSAFIAVEIYPPVDEFRNLFGCVFNHLLYGSSVADEITCNHGVFDMLIEIVNLEIGN